MSSFWRDERREERRDRNDEGEQITNRREK